MVRHRVPGPVDSCCLLSVDARLVTHLDYLGGVKNRETLTYGSRTIRASSQQPAPSTFTILMPSYIVSFRTGTPQAAIDDAAKAVESAGGKIGHRYDGTTLLGFSATFPETFISTLDANEHVDFVEPDQEV
ncbi:hypothetical protein SeMB42_g08006, partial [Synchytrium endobioticum]